MPSFDSEQPVQTSPRFPGWLGRLWANFGLHATAALMVMAIVVGTGLAVVVFIKAIGWITDFSFQSWLPQYLGGGGPAWVILIPILGSLISGPIIAYWALEAKGHGVPEVMQSIITLKGRIRPRVAAVKSIASSICIGTGGSAGREGPIVQVGAALGSTAAQLFEPEGVVAADGRLFIADTNNHLIRVADLAAGRVDTLMLHGLEKLVSPQESALEAAQQMEPLVVGPGEVAVNLLIELPPGYKLNPDAPPLLQVGAKGSRGGYTFQAGEPVRFKIEAEAENPLDLNLTVYYCQSGDERLCLIHDARLIVPLQVKGEGKTEVEVRYSLPLPQ